MVDVQEMQATMWKQQKFPQHRKPTNDCCLWIMKITKFQCKIPALCGLRSCQYHAATKVSPSADSIKLITLPQQQELPSSEMQKVSELTLDLARLKDNKSELTCERESFTSICTAVM
jgi:hypothetical protein